MGTRGTDGTESTEDTKGVHRGHKEHTGRRGYMWHRVRKRAQRGHGAQWAHGVQRAQWGYREGRGLGGHREHRERKGGGGGKAAVLHSTSRGPLKCMIRSPEGSAKFACTPLGPPDAHVSRGKDARGLCVKSPTKNLL